MSKLIEVTVSVPPQSKEALEQRTKELRDQATLEARLDNLEGAIILMGGCVDTV